MYHRITAEPPAVTIGEQVFPIAAQDYDELMEGAVPATLSHRIQKTYGEEVAMDFAHKVHLIRQIQNQIEAGDLPRHLLPLVTSGLPSTEVLQNLSAHKLPRKAAQLYRRKLISKEEMDVIQSQLITEEILPALSRALLLYIAEYLYQHNEITRDILNGFYDGSIDLFFVPILQKQYRKMKYVEEVPKKYYLLPPTTQEDFDESYLNNLPSQDAPLEELMIRQQNSEKLHEALTWLSPGEQKLIEDIYEKNIPISQIASAQGVQDRSIRWRRDQILKKLRWILETFHHIHRDSIT